MSGDEHDFRLRPGRSRDAGGSGGKSQRLAAQVRRASAKAGHTRLGPSAGKGSGSFGRGRRALALCRLRANSRRVVIKARIVRHKGARFRSAPLGKHIAYLEREGVTRDGREAAMFDARGDAADRDAFAARCEDDRHHFRFIVSPEDAAEMVDLRGFTRELMQGMARDLGTDLDWIAVDHWNTDNPHIHVLVRGQADDGHDLVIDRGYISSGLRARAEEQVTLELGPRSEREIRATLAREVEAERWTSLDRHLQRLGADNAGVIDLRPNNGSSSVAGDDKELRRLALGRVAKLEQLGLASREGAGLWMVSRDAEPTLRALAERGDIIKTMHRAMARGGNAFDASALAIHGETTSDPVVGSLVERGLHDELAGSAYAIVDGVDGHTHHLRFSDIELTGDAKPGAIVELRSWEHGEGQVRFSLATRSDLALKDQVTAPGATWLDRQMLAREPATSRRGFGLEVQGAMAARGAHLTTLGLARRQGPRLILADDLLGTLKTREMAQATSDISARTGLAHKPSVEGNFVSGTYRERVTLSSGRFAMIDDGLSFQLVPWRPALDKHLGQHVTGTMARGGSVDWALGRGRAIGL